VEFILTLQVIEHARRHLGCQACVKLVECCFDSVNVGCRGFEPNIIMIAGFMQFCWDVEMMSWKSLCERHPEYRASIENSVSN
jgi:hypothetical protein